MTRPKPLSPEQIEELLKMYNSGMSQTKCAHHFGCSQSFVSTCLKDRPEADPRNSTWKKKRIDELVALYRSGLSVQACSRRMNTAKATVRKYLKQRKVKIRPHIEMTKRGEGHYAWKGGRTVGEYVYLKRPDHPHRNYNGYVLEHRLVMEEHVGRYLDPKEVVHHKNRNKHDNRLDNLELFQTNAEHLASELKGQCPRWTAEGRERIRQASWQVGKPKRKKIHPKPYDPPSP